MLSFQLIDICNSKVIFKVGVDTYTESIEGFFSKRLWTNFLEKDKKILSSYIKNKRIKNIEPFTAIYGETTFSLPYSFALHPILTGVIILFFIIQHLVFPDTVFFVDVFQISDLLFYPLILCCINTINELYGYKRARASIWCTFCGLLFIGAILQIFINIPSIRLYGISEYTQLMHFYFLKDLSRRLIYSAIMFLVASQVNAITFQLIKSYTNSLSLWLSILVSSLFFIVVYISISNVLTFNNIYFVSAGFNISMCVLRIAFLLVSQIPLVYLVTYLAKSSHKKKYATRPDDISDTE